VQDHDLTTISGAILSDDRKYRYLLWRMWDEGPRLVYVMLNPSTADGVENDPTIRRCINFAKRDGYGAIDVVNLYALRATDPDELKGRPCEELEGPLNGMYWHEAFSTAAAVVAAWGAWWDGQSFDSRPLRRTINAPARMHGLQVLCLGLTKSGAPRHPLMVKKDQPFVPYEGS